MKRKHRIVVEVTFDRAISERDAAKYVGVAMDRVDATTAIRKYFVYAGVPRVVKTGTKRLSCVLVAEKRKT